ncbi:MAG TPA: hypothetical protein VHA71_11910 [Rhodanobacteraceae bacterium]|nr:hypothetical protein [Rhodanobacteraceae bacterium]
MKRTPVVLARGLGHSALLGFFCAAMLASGSAIAQMGGGMKAMLQQKLEAIKASSAENQQKLHQYTWTETASITANGREIPPKVSNCFYGPDGKVHKTPVGDPQEASMGGGRGGRLMQRIKEKKTAEMKDYMQQVSGVIKLYVPPSPERMQKAFEARKVSFDKTGGRVDLVFKDYALPGDSMTVDFDTASKKIRSLNVKSYLDTPQNPGTLKVDFATLPDGTNHPSRTSLDARGQDIIEVTTVNSNYRKTSGF